MANSNVGTTLVVLAAGLGSRYGGLKQLEGFGPQGEKIIEYTVHDAFKAGFNRVVCVVQPAMEEDFDNIVGKTIPSVYAPVLAYQTMESLPRGVKIDCKGRTKPWGTAHALWCAKEASLQKQPFAVVNADDFYGAHAFRALHQALVEMGDESLRCVMVGYPLGKTLSEAGTVSRGVCEVDAQGGLMSIVEHTKIAREGNRIVSRGEPYAGEEHALPADRVVSMNCWGFSCDFWMHLEDILKQFFATPSQYEKGECYIPWAVERWIAEQGAQCRVLPEGRNWCGVTYAEDAEKVRGFLAQLTEQGEYAQPLFSDMV